MVGDMIRSMTMEDCQPVAEMGRKFHDQAGWSDIMDYRVDDCVASLQQFMAAGVFAGFVSDNGGIDGMIGGVFSPVYFNHSHLSCEELFWFVDDAPQSAGLKLLRTMEETLREMGASSIQMKTLSKLNDERMPAMMTRMGYRASERSWIKRL